MTHKVREITLPVENLSTFSLPVVPGAQIALSGGGLFQTGSVINPGPVPNDTDLRIIVNGWSFGTDNPRIVLLQPRQGENFDRGFPDQFALQVISTGRDFIKFSVLRVDVNDPENLNGWGQNLRIDILVVP